MAVNAYRAADGRRECLEPADGAVHLPSRAAAPAPRQNQSHLFKYGGSLAQI